MEEYLRNLSDNVFIALGNMNCSNTVAAELWGLNRNELRSILKCEKNVKLSTLVRLSEVTGISVSDLLCIPK